MSSEKLLVKYHTSTQTVPGGTEVHYAHYVLYSSNPGSPLHLSLKIERPWLDIPCRSNLHKLLIGLLFNWDWHAEGKEVEVTPEQARHLAIIFANQKTYTFWKEGVEIVNGEGKEAAWEWIYDRIPVLKLKSELER